MNGILSLADWKHDQKNVHPFAPIAFPNTSSPNHFWHFFQLVNQPLSWLNQGATAGVIRIARASFTWRHLATTCHFTSAQPWKNWQIRGVQRLPPWVVTCLAVCSGDLLQNVHPWCHHNKHVMVGKVFETFDDFGTGDANQCKSCRYHDEGWMFQQSPCWSSALQWCGIGFPKNTSLMPWHR